MQSIPILQEQSQVPFLPPQSHQPDNPKRLNPQLIPILQEGSLLPPQSDQLENAKRLIAQLTQKLNFRDSEIVALKTEIQRKTGEWQQAISRKQGELKKVGEQRGRLQKESRQSLDKKQSELKGILQEYEKLKANQNALRGENTNLTNEFLKFKKQAEQNSLHATNALRALKVSLLHSKLNSLRLSYLRSLFSSIQLKTSKEYGKSKAELALKVGEVSQLTALSKDQKSKLAELSKNLQASQVKLTQSEAKAHQLQKNILLVSQASEAFKKEAERKQKDLISEIGLIKKNLAAARQEQSQKETQHFQREFKIHQKYRQDIIKLKQNFSKEFAQLRACIPNDLSPPAPDLDSKIRDIQKSSPEHFAKISQTVDLMRKELRRCQAKQVELQVLNKMYLLKLQEVLNGRAKEQDSEVTF